MGQQDQCLHELFTPICKALVAVPSLLGIGIRCVLQPINEELLVFLQYQELAQYHIGLEGGKYSQIIVGGW